MDDSPRGALADGAIAVIQPTTTSFGQGRAPIGKPPFILVTVDTEEEGLWGGNYRPTGNTVTNIAGVPRFQSICAQHGVRPVYLVTAPVVDDDLAASVLGEIHAQGGCEIGAHLHPWCTPPLEDPNGRAYSFMCNLPLDLQRRKLTWLSERIETRFGSRPVSFRAGRYGLDMAGARALADLGYRVDSSVIAFSNFSSERGPDFSRAPFKPYYLEGDDLCRPNPQGFLLEVPVSVGFNRSNFAAAWRLRQAAMRSPWRQFKAVGIVDRLGLAKRIKLSPEQASAAEMIQLASAALAQGAPALVMLLHSSSLAPGHSPYVADARRLDQFLADLDRTLEYCVGRRGMTPATLAELAPWGPNLAAWVES